MIPQSSRGALPALLLALLATVAAAETKRIAIVVGNNAGTGEMPPLRYAESDAGKIARVLVELGDVSQEDVMLLQGQSVAQIERAIGEARDRVASSSARPTCARWCSSISPGTPTERRSSSGARSCRTRG